jgi:hypothetical protein
MVEQDHDDLPAKSLGLSPSAWRVWARLALVMALIVGMGVYRGSTDTIILVFSITIAGVVAYVLLAAVRLRRFDLARLHHLEYVPFDPDAPETPRHASRVIKEAVAQFTPLGFAVKGHLARHAWPSTTVYLSVCENERTSDVAVFFASLTESKYVTGWETFAAFFTVFTPDCKCTTDNSKTINPFPPIANEIRWQFPGVEDIGRLYTVHKELLRRSGRSAETRVSLSENWDEYMQTGQAKIYAKYAEMGFARLDETAEIYRPTWKGAFFMIWTGTWPMSAIRRFLLRRRAGKLLESLGV